jgi:hypothetical protein
MSQTTKTLTPFEQAKKDLYEGKIQAPSVSMGNRQIPYFRYQLNVHKFNLKIMSSGMTCRGVKLRDLKNYYGLKGKTAADCLPQLEKIIADYEQELTQSN